MNRKIMGIVHEQTKQNKKKNETKEYEEQEYIKANIHMEYMKP